MPSSKFVFPVFVALLLFLILISITENDIVAGDEIDLINGVSLVAPSKELEEDPFSSIVDVNANWVAIMPYAFTDGNTPEVYFDNDRQWWGEKSFGVIKTIENAKAKNIKTLLKPHVWVKGQGWTGDFKLETEADWKLWEENYTTYIMNFARIADSLKVEAFCIGLEFKNVVKERPQFWSGLISEVRKEYGGMITYAANWDNYQNITFWDEVDFIGINAYFPLSQDSTPSVATLKKSWEKEKQLLFELSKKHQKPIVFTEFGYRSIDKSAGNQWEFEHHRNYKGIPNLVAQENAYVAIFESFWEEPWFRGGFLWKWYPESQISNDKLNSDYTPQQKPVELIIQEWYKNHTQSSRFNY